MKTVLCCSGLDPTGGAGLQADIEAISAQGAHAMVVATTLTAQDTRNVVLSVPVDTDLLESQLATLRGDCRIDAIKIGLLGHPQQLPLLQELIIGADCPVVVDPVLRAGGGTLLVDASFAQRYAETLFPHCTVLTPNADEARRLTGMDDLDAAGAALLGYGVRHVLITCGDEPGSDVCNHWHSSAGLRRFEQRRIDGAFHGAGCTLASTIAARLAIGDDVETALVAAQDYVAGTLRRAYVVGKGRLIPNRAAPLTDG